MGTVALSRHWFRRRYSARWYAVAIVAATLIPALVVAWWLAMWSARSERVQREQSARNQAREVAAAIDREVAGVQNVLAVLAGSPALRDGDIRGFYDQLVLATRRTGFQFVLRDRRADIQLANTALPWGAPLGAGPQAPLSDVAAEQFRGGSPVVSNVFFGPLAKEHVVAVLLPIHRDGVLRYSLAVAVPLTKFAAVLDSLDKHPDQLVTIIDRTGTIVARSEKHAEFAGTPIRVPLPLDTQNVSRSRNREGIGFHWFNRRSDTTGWYISVGVPDRVLQASADYAFISFLTFGGLLFVAAIVLSYRWGGRLAQSAGVLGIDRKPRREEFEVLFDSAPNGVVVIGGDGTVMLVNSRLETMFGYDRGALVGKPLEILLPERLRAEHSKLRAGFDNAPEPRTMAAGYEPLGRRKDGSEFPVEVALNPVSTAAGNFVMATVIDISARKLAQKRLSSAVAERDDLRRRFLQAQEGERLRLAHDLHDQTGQSIAAAMLELKGIEALARDAERDRLRLLRRQMEEIGKTLHRVAWELRPASIDEVGLAGALNNYLSEWSTQYGIEADFFSAAELDSLSDELRTTLYRVVQEALTNVTKHAQGATQVSVVIERTQSLLRLTIDDNGSGFDTSASQVPESGRIGGFGLAGMRERVMLIGGTIEIESSLESGTTIYVRIPLPQETSEHERPIANLAG